MKIMYDDGTLSCGYFSKIAMLVLFFLLLSGCSNTPGKDVLQSAFNNASPSYADGAIKLTIDSTLDLNSYHHQSNSCSLFVVQADDRSVLDKLITDNVTLQKLFSGEEKLGGALQINQFSLMPNQHVISTLSRAERAKYIAIIAGYYPRPGPEHAYVVSFPLKLQKHGWLFPDYSADFEPLDIKLKLGRINIIQAEFKPRGDQFMLAGKVPAAASQTQAQFKKSGGEVISEISDKASQTLLDQANHSLNDNVDNLMKKITSSDAVGSE